VIRIPDTVNNEIFYLLFNNRYLIFFLILIDTLGVGEHKRILFQIENENKNKRTF
jgi:hypothetical protein